MAREINAPLGQATLWYKLGTQRAWLPHEKEMNEALGNVSCGQVQPSREVYDICSRNHKGNSESVKENRRVDKERGEKTVLRAIATVCEASCEDVETLTGLSHQSASARISDLKRAGKLVKCGTTKTKSGCSASVYRLA